MAPLIDRPRRSDDFSGAVFHVVSEAVQPVRFVLGYPLINPKSLVTVPLTFNLDYIYSVEGHFLQAGLPSNAIE